MDKPNKLKEFFLDKAMMNVVAEHFLGYLEKAIVKEAFKGNDTSEYKKVRDILDGGFRDLDGKFTEKSLDKPTEFTQSE